MTTTFKICVAAATNKRPENCQRPLLLVLPMEIGYFKDLKLTKRKFVAPKNDGEKLKDI